MNKQIFKDINGTYFLEYDSNGNLKKIYCDENGEKELFQDDNGLYYVEYDEKGLPGKAYCDEDGNRLVSVEFNSQNVTKVDNIGEDASVSVVEEQWKYQENTTQVEQAGIIGVNQRQEVITETRKEEINSNFSLERKDRKSKIGAWIGVSIAVLGIILGGCFIYSNFLVKPSVNLENYQIKFDTTGSNGQGKPDVEIEGIPVVENADYKSQEEKTAIDKLLAEPVITYSKTNGLVNGDQVEVTLDIVSSKAAEYDLEVLGKFKHSFIVSGLSEDSKLVSSTESSDEKATSNETNKNWFAVDGVLRPGGESHPDTQLKNGFNSWAASQNMSLERMKGGAEFGGTILGNKVILDDKTIELRFLRYRGETQETVKAGELLNDVYNIVGIFSDKSSVIYILAIYNGEAQFIKAELDGGKPETKDGLIVFEDANNSEVKNMLQGVIDRMK